MKNVLRISNFAASLKGKNSVILWNRMIGGCIAITPKLFNVLKSGNIDGNIVSAETGNELKAANILINNGEDELKNLAEQSKEFIDSAVSCVKLRCLELSVSEHCNYQCIYCTFWRNKSSSKQKYITTEVAEKALRDFLDVTYERKEVVVYFGTAEPLMNWETIVYISQLAKELRPDISLNLITNGSLMTEERLKFCRENGINVGISFDGLPDRQNKQRIPSSGDVNSSEAVLKLLELGNKINFTFSCLSATYSQTGFKADIEYLIGICKKYGIQEFDLDFDVNHLGKVNTKILKDELLFGYQKTKDAGLNIFGYWMIPFLNIVNGGSGIKSFCGNVIGESVCISSEGNFKLCGYEKTSAHKYISLKKHLSSKEFKSVCESRMPNKNQLCANCIIEGVCGGQCMLADTTSQSWKNTCTFYQKITKELLINHFSNK